MPATSTREYAESKSKYLLSLLMAIAASIDIREKPRIIGVPKLMSPSRVIGELHMVWWETKNGSRTEEEEEEGGRGARERSKCVRGVIDPERMSLKPKSLTSFIFGVDLEEEDV
ncbi:hypothetical protein Hypma_002961 [Hypsizygus marmoreus]|uniref:Uncharacterized protein n=1 Tax=Hypsizygus marmoreus TaxID=39966 RepID=A0A369J4S2_HYPMA|nr:hypothetical protein Hypma_002961 [Hypsizygus marmoreus]